MKKKPFALSGIFKIREYAEQKALHVYLMETQRDRALANSYELLGQEITELGARPPHEIEKRRYYDEYLTHCNNVQKSIQTQRELIKEDVKKAQNKYDEARLSLESVKILKNKHNDIEKKEIKKEFYSQMQERIIWEDFYNS